jgi:hypothetical protein
LQDHGTGSKKLKKSKQLDALDAAAGYYFVYVEPTQHAIRGKSLNPFNKSWWKYRDSLSATVVVSRLTVHTCAVPEGLCVFAVDVVSGKPRKGVNIWAFWSDNGNDFYQARASNFDESAPSHSTGSKKQKKEPSEEENEALADQLRLKLGTTDEFGCAFLPTAILPAAKKLAKALSCFRYYTLDLVAQDAGDMLFFEYSESSATADETMWYVFDDRKLYKPKEEVHIKGEWLLVPFCECLKLTRLPFSVRFPQDLCVNSPTEPPLQRLLT